MTQSDLFDVKGKVAIVTGGAGVLGGAMASGLAAAGVCVGILGRTAEKVQRKVEAIKAAGGEAIPLVADVLDQAQLEAARQKAIDAWGHIDILLNVAGGNRAGATIGPKQNFFDLSIDDFDQVVALNLKGTVLPTYVFGQDIAKQGAGSIVNISSLTAQQPFTRVVGYAAAKAAIDNFTKWLSVEMASKYGGKIRVNAIAPGVFIGEQNRSLLLDAHKNLTPRGSTIIEHTPMKRFGEAGELIGATLLLASEKAGSFITGHELIVDGGYASMTI